MPNGNVGTFKRAVALGEDSFAEWSKPYANLGMRPQQLRSIYDQQRRDVMYLSEFYQVAINKTPRHAFPGVVLWWLSIKLRDKEPIMDWRDLQAIKSQLCGDEAEAIQLFPAESRVVDTSNQYHLFVFMKSGGKRLPQVPIHVFGPTRQVTPDNEPHKPGYVEGAKQRPLVDDPLRDAEERRAFADEEGERIEREGEER
jgi:hypothetical protein